MKTRINNERQMNKLKVPKKNDCKLQTEIRDRRSLLVIRHSSYIKKFIKF